MCSLLMTSTGVYLEKKATSEIARHQTLDQEVRVPALAGFICFNRVLGQDTLPANRGIFADIIVYIFAHLHRALRTEGNVL